MPKTLVKFTRPSGPYATDDIAGFDNKEDAQRYIDAKVAEAYEAPKDARKQGAKGEGA